MGKLDSIKWDIVSDNLKHSIFGCPLGTHQDLMRMWCNLADIARDISRLEVVERRTQGSTGRQSSEKLTELLNGIKHLDQMILIAHLQCS